MHLGFGVGFGCLGSAMGPEYLFSSLFGVKDVILMLLEQPTASLVSSIPVRRQFLYLLNVKLGASCIVLSLSLFPFFGLAQFVEVSDLKLTLVFEERSRFDV